LGITRWSGRRTGRALGLLAAAILAASMISPVIGTDETVPPGEKDPENLDGVVTWSGPPSEERDEVGILGAAAPSQFLMHYVALDTGCRILDTRVDGGNFSSGEFRDVPVFDGDLPEGLGPCGVPGHAAAVAISLSTLNTTPTGTGFARVGPGGQAPRATVLQFRKEVGISVTTDVTLDFSGQFRLQSFGAGSGYVVDLLGYWETPVWGRVAADGTLIAGSGVTEVVKSTVFLGDYSVVFDRQISPHCSAAVSMEEDEVRLFSTPGASSWFFDVRDFDSIDEADGGFSFVINCS
jgi:hypothetical protein